MENPVLQIKDALIRVLKKIDPDTDVFFEEIKSTDPAHGVEQPKTWYFVDLKPGNPVTVDGIYTDMSVMVDVTYHEKGESNNTYHHRECGHQCSGSRSPLHFYYQFPALRRTEGYK